MAKRLFMMTLPILLIVGLFAAFIFFNPPQQRDSVNSTGRDSNLGNIPGYNESMELARQRVLDSYQYRNYDGRNLQLRQVEQDTGCGNCWRFIYVFRVSSERLPEGVETVEISVDVNDGRIGNTTMTEIVR
jgi:hypothetical protein